MKGDQKQYSEPITSNPAGRVFTLGVGAVLVIVVLGVLFLSYLLNKNQAAITELEATIESIIIKEKEMQESIAAQLLVQKAEAEALKKHEIDTATFMNKATESIIAQEKSKEEKKREKSRAEEVVEVDYQGEELEIGFNVSYLLDVLNNIASDSVKISLSDPNSSALIECADSNSSLYVVMPMRL